MKDVFGQPLAGYKVEKPTIWQRLGFGNCDAPYFDDDQFGEGWAPGQISTSVYAVLDWRDRLRVLISGRIKTATAIKTDHVVVQSYSACNFSVLPPRTALPWNPGSGTGSERDENLSKP
jgi:hypothetical protein